MHLEEFAEGTTLLHHLDPRVKFLTAAPMLIAIALTHGLYAPLYALALGTILAIWARLDIQKLMARLITVNIFVALLAVLLPFTHAGTTAFSIGSLTASREGIDLALQIALKSNAIVLITIAMFGTSEVFTLAHGLLHLHAPAKLVYLFFFFYRYLSVLHSEYDKLRNAMRVRCFRSKKFSAHTYRSLGFLIGMLMVRSYERSRRIYQAMLCRGFRDGYFPVAKHFHYHQADKYFSVGAVVCAIPLVMLWQ
jgi:cobalt/nickel transport system permease protein